MGTFYVLILELSLSTVKSAGRDATVQHGHQHCWGSGLVVDAISTMAISKEPTAIPGGMGGCLEPQPEKQKSTGLVPKTPQKRST